MTSTCTKAKSKWEIIEEWTASIIAADTSDRTQLHKAFRGVDTPVIRNFRTSAQPYLEEDQKSKVGGETTMSRKRRRRW
ncbi:unnamed protein product [Hermetia illucens]|uniref:Uncharacterized protein n=1 Tax=Hermetia illucens TaxID=343691 RepID=A0A7R8V6Y9_HERIL|nr:unnamed protein product [Hermetia illucens]